MNFDFDVEEIYFQMCDDKEPSEVQIAVIRENLKAIIRKRVLRRIWKIKYGK